MRGVFRDRKEAGRRLAELLDRFVDADPVVLALPRGGVPIGFEVAQRLGAPLDVAVVRKVGAPDRPELGIGAVGEGGARFIDQDMMYRLGLTEDLLEPAVREAEREVEEGIERYRGDQPKIPLEGRTVILVDDGIATGGSMRAAIQVARQQGAKWIVLAVPVAGPDSLRRLSPDVEEIVCVDVSPMLWAVGLAYEEFEQVPTETVRGLLAAAREHRDGDTSGIVHAQEVLIETDGVRLEGELTIPRGASGLVLFVHGSGSNRHSRRNKRVARFLQEAGVGTLLFDLLSPEEQRIDSAKESFRYDVDLIGRRTVGAIDWARSQRRLRSLPKACFGASTGAAGAFIAAARRPAEVMAVVSRGGRPDLAERYLPKVRAPCLLLVGERDLAVLSVHSEVIDRFGGHTHLVVVHGAGHLFEEPGAMDEVGRRTADFLRRNLQLPPEVRA